jgi:hypothetical protein
MSCFPKNTFSQGKGIVDNILYYRGDTIEFVPERPPSGGNTWARPPIKLNGEKIYTRMEYNPKKEPVADMPKIKSKHKNLPAYLHAGIQDEVKKLDSGKYFFWIENVVVDEKGKVVYYENNGVFQMRKDIDLQKQRKETIDKKIASLLDEATFEPAQLDGKPVPYLIPSIHSFYYGYEVEQDLIINNHKVIWDITTAPETN